MRYFSQNSITRPGLNLIEQCIRSKKSEITLHYPNNRQYTITPVLILSVRKTTFQCHFMSNPYFYLDLDTLDGSLFTHVYNWDGTPIHVKAPISQYTAKCYEHVRHDIYIPRILEVGDILLCGNVYPIRKTADSEPVLV